MLCLTRIEVLSNIWTLRLFSTNHSDSLNFDQHTRAGEAGNGDEGTGRKIVFRKHLTPNLYKAVAVADIGDEYRHGHHVIEAPASALQCPVDRGECRALLLPRREFKILRGVRGRREQHAESKNCRYPT